MALAWWSAAGVLTVVMGFLYRSRVVILSAANPSARLPWVGRPAKVPGSTKVLEGIATMANVFMLNCVFDALGRRNPYDILWGVPLALFALAIGLVTHAQHNRRVRQAA